MAKKNDLSVKACRFKQYEGQKRMTIYYTSGQNRTTQNINKVYYDEKEDTCYVKHDDYVGDLFTKDVLSPVDSISQITKDGR